MFRNKIITPEVGGIGGATSNSNSISGRLRSMNWSFIMYGVLIILLVVFAYYTYKQYTNSNTSTYHANRENIPVNKQSNNQAELILFYVDWCPHCKTAKPEWENLKAEYEGKTINGYTVIFTEYNCTDETAEIEQLINKYKIEGYPTIKLLKDNQIIEYDAKPTKTTLEQFLNTVL